MLIPISSNDPSVKFCLVGTGPVGIALAFELERRGHDVLVLESGDIEVKPSEASGAEIVDPHRHVSMDLAVCRALGGTSWTWGGRCVRYDAVDWMQRDFVPESRWPIGPEEVTRWTQRAAEILNCGERFDIPYPSKLIDDLKLDSVRMLLATFAVNARSSRTHSQVGADPVQSQNNCHRNEFRPRWDVSESLEVSTPLGPFQVRARRFVCHGRVETNRFLLNVQPKWPARFGGIDGPLGRYYMGDISGKIASVLLYRPRDPYGHGSLHQCRRFRLASSRNCQPLCRPFQCVSLKWTGNSTFLAVTVAFASPNTGSRARRRSGLTRRSMVTYPCGNRSTIS